jgi:hypothetical protein
MGSVWRARSGFRNFLKKECLFFFRDFEILATIFWSQVTERVEYSVQCAMGLGEE